MGNFIILLHFLRVIDFQLIRNNSHRSCHFHIHSQDNFPRIWVNSLPNLPMLSRHLKEDESSSSSQQSASNVHATHTDANTNNHDVFGINKTVNKYTSFGQYIADTLQGMDEKYANELHVHILEEIIKIKSKIFKES